MTTAQDTEAKTHYKDRQGRAWEFGVITYGSARCEHATCPSFAAYEVIRSATGLRRRELRCLKHARELREALGMTELTMPPDHDAL